MLDHAAVCGSPKAGTYSQTLVIGNFFLVLSLEGPPEQVGLELGRNALAKIEEIITQTPEISPKELVEIQQEAFILSKAEGFSDGIKLNLLVAQIENQKLFLASYGEVDAKLIRKNKIIHLLPQPFDSALGKPATSLQSPASNIQQVSGTLLHKDLLILGTGSFFSEISLSDLFPDFTAEVGEIRDLVSPKIETMAENSQIAVLLVKVDLQNIESIDYPLTSNPTTHSQTPIAPRSFPRSSRSLPPFSNLVSRILNLVSRSNRSLYLHRPRDPNAPTPTSRRILYLSLIILISLISLIAFQLRSRVLEERAKAVQDINQQVRDGLDSAQKLSGLNDQIARDVLLQTRRDLIERAERTFGANWEKDKSSEARKVQKILADLDKEITKISKVYNLSTLDLFYDFSLLRSGAKISSLWIHKEEVIALDINNGSIYSLSLTTKGAAIITGHDDLKKGKFLDFSGSKAYVWTMDGILSLDRSVSPAATKMILKPTDKWGDIKDLKVFAGNIYLLDSQNNQIWKYQNTDLGFAEIGNYLNSGVPVDFSNVKDMAIDGSIYVLTTTGNIAQFSSGSPQNFKIQGVDPKFSDPVNLFTNDEVNNLYILDSNGKRVVVINKKGLYVAQYLLPLSSIPQPVSRLIADESLHKVFLFSGPKVYSFNIQ